MSSYMSSAGFRTQQRRQVLEWSARNQPKNSFSASAGVHTDIVAGASMAPEVGCCYASVVGPSPLTDRSDIYMTGVYYDSPLEMIDSTGSTYNPLPQPAGPSTVYLMKYNSAGLIQWYARIGKENIYSNYLCLCADTTDSLYIIGICGSAGIDFYTRTNDLTPSISLTYTGTEPNAKLLWIAKYSTEGQVEWATYISTTSATQVRPSIFVSPDHGIVITGFYTGMLNIYNASGNNPTYQFNLPTATDADNFLVKFNTDGQAQWGTHIGGTGSDETIIVNCDGNNNIFISGSYNSSTLSFYNQNDQITPAIQISKGASKDNYLAKYDGTGNVLWATNISGNGDENRANVAADSMGNVYISGFGRSTSINFFNASDQGTPAATITSAQDGIYLAKYDGNGTFLWATHVEGGYNSQPYIVVDNADNVILAGQTTTTEDPPISPTRTFNIYNTSGGIDRTLPLASIYNNSSVFLIKYSPSGAVIWATYMEMIGNIYPRPSVTCDANGDICIAGIFTRTSGLTTLGFYNAATPPVASGLSLTTDLLFNTSFVVKYTAAGTAVWATQNTSTNPVELPFVSSPFKPWI